MSNLTIVNTVRYQPTLMPEAVQKELTHVLEKTSSSLLNSNEANKTTNDAPIAKRQSDTYKATIYGSDPAPAPETHYTSQEREHHIDAFADRVKTQIEQVESGSEGERNVKFQNVRLFMEPAGYFSGGLLAAGYDPHEKITVTFNSYVGMGTGKNLSNTEKRTYFAWEIAAGALEHDKPAKSGIVNFNEMEIDQKDRTKINDLQSFGKRLQNYWERDIATPMRGSAADNSIQEIAQFLSPGVFLPKPKQRSMVIPERSAKADAYVARGALESLRGDKGAFEKLSAAGQEAVSRTLDKNGQVILPNIYGYPLSGYAFIPNTPYDGSREHRPNQGVMVDLKNGAVREIKGDNDFAAWAKDNRNELISRFNASDLQGGKDAHWPSASGLLDNLIQDNRSHYPGRSTLISDKSVPVRELFNYTEARDSGYELKFGDLNNGIASHYQEVNAKNAVWADQTKVFGAVEQGWKNAKEVWGNTFGYLPIIGNAGNIVFGVHDANHGMTASDRVGGTAGAVISGLMLAHEVIPAGLEAGLGDAPLNFNASGNERFNWRYNSQTSAFELERAPKSTSHTDEHPVTPKQPPDVASTPQAASFAGMREIEFNGRQYFVAEKPDAGDEVNYLLRVRDPNDPSKLASSAIIASPNDAGVWKRRGEVGGGRWPWQRPASPSPSIEAKIPLMSEQFLEIDGTKMKGATTLDKYLETEKHEYVYGIAVNDKGENMPQVSWTVEENPANATPPPDLPTIKFGTSSYDNQFIDDLNRSKFTFEKPDGTKLEFDVGADIKSFEHSNGKPASEEEIEAIKQRNILALESFIPDPALRARISQVANQWLQGPIPEEIRARFKGDVFSSGTDPHYYINYDPASDDTTVTSKSGFNLTRLIDNPNTNDIPELETIKDININTSRTITIRASNEIDSDGYTIKKSAPIRIEVTPKLD
ncbi:hypothetical protein [Pseudomonas sp. W4I3]|uniref:hypothetical protein n=1 Tax=Pseudomonas sp. W4I3 TaxID=3042294 RepID=UPI002783C2F2|nr:hypothetical protein [Pseudomonas sp. W4I3]MDQ0738552.1 hypothetical protein [Pseudomonas sp. W4I3]